MLSLPRLFHRTCLALLLALPAIRAAADDEAARYRPEAYLAQMQHKSVAVAAIGSGPQRAYVFMPQGPTPSGVPLVLFHHGWLGMSPKNFGSLIDLLVRRGAVVIYPVYQDGKRTSPQEVTRLAGQADGAALRYLRQQHPGLVDETRTFYAGFSMGAAISLNLALDPAAYDLPPPRALLLMAPGNAHHVAHGADARDIYGPVEMLPADLPTVLVSGAADTTIGVPTARALAARLCHLRQRSLLIFPSDSNNGSRILSGHGSPGAPDSRYDFPDAQAALPGLIPPREGFEASVSLNLLDFHGYWRLATGLMDHVSSGKSPAMLFTNTPENRYLGAWPDGTPYAEARFEDPCPPAQ